MIQNMPCKPEDFKPETKECGLCKIVNDNDYNYCKYIQDKQKEIKKAYELLNGCIYKEITPVNQVIRKEKPYNERTMNVLRESGLIEESFRCTCNEKDNKYCKEEIGCLKYVLTESSNMNMNEIKKEIAELKKIENKLQNL